MKNSTTKPDFSVLIPDGESTFALPVLRCLGQVKNVRTIISSNNPHAPVRFSRYAGRFVSYKNTEGEAGMLAAILKIAGQTHPDVILPVDEAAIRLFAANKAAFSGIARLAPLPCPDAFDIAADKWLLAEWLKGKQLPHPKTILYQGDGEFKKALSGMSFPVLIKPRRGGGGTGIEYFENAFDLNSYCQKNIGPEEFIVQSFIEGYDIDCSVICHEGEILAYTIQKGFMGGTYRFSIPSGIEFLEEPNTYNLVAGLVKKFNWSGIIHIDLRYDKRDKRIKIIEMNPRFWGSLPASFFAGVNFPYIACLAGLNLDLPEIVIQHKRVIHPKATISLLAKRLVGKKQKDMHFDNSIFEFLLKDPLPLIYSEFSKTYNKR